MEGHEWWSGMFSANYPPSIRVTQPCTVKNAEALASLQLRLQGRHDATRMLAVACSVSDSRQLQATEFELVEEYEIDDHFDRSIVFW
jgi:hypothetical protein